MPTPSVSCFVYPGLPNQTRARRISCSFLPTREIHLDEKLSHSPQVIPENLLASMKPSKIDMKNDISHVPVGVLVFSFQLAITPPL